VSLSPNKKQKITKKLQKVPPPKVKAKYQKNKNKKIPNPQNKTQKLPHKNQLNKNKLPLP